MNSSECEVKNFICVVGTKIAVDEVSENVVVSYIFGGFKDQQSVAVLREEIEKDSFGDIERVKSENFFLPVSEGEMLKLPNKQSNDGVPEKVFITEAVHPERNSIQLRERTIAS